MPKKKRATKLAGKRAKKAARPAKHSKNVPAKAAKRSTKMTAKQRAKSRPAKQQKTASRSKRVSRPSATDFAKLTLRQIIRTVAEHLEGAGYDPVLTGSACAAIYAGSALRPTSIDFVVNEYNASELGEVMRGVGFVRASMNHFESRKSPFDVIFLPPPLAVGDDVVRETVTVQARPGSIRLLSSTDCVRQRLSMFYRWGDRKAFDEAVMVAKQQSVDMDLIRRWSEWEWCTDKYDEFVEALERGRSS
jgi:hypothetical protein